MAEISSVSRRGFLGAAGATMASVLAGGSSETGALPQPSSGSVLSPEQSQRRKKIPIGVFDPVYEKLSLDEMLDKVSALGLEAMEIGVDFNVAINQESDPAVRVLSSTAD